MHVWIDTRTGRGLRLCRPHSLSVMPGSICLKHPVKLHSCNQIYVHTSEKNFQNISISRYSPIATAARSGST